MIILDTNVISELACIDPEPNVVTWLDSLPAAEIATIAITAASPQDTDANWSEAEKVAAIHVRLLLFGTSIVIEVWDSKPTTPMPRDVTGEQESGRGLAIVAALSTKWSWFPVPRGGKVVWAELPIPDRPLTGAGLPQRSRPGMATAGNQGVIRDRDLLRRVHRGLQSL